MKKSYYYIGLIALLLGINLFLFFFPIGSKPGNASRVYLEDHDLSKLTSITFTNADQLIIDFRKKDDSWILNDSLKVDEGFFETLLSILARVEMTRQFSRSEEEVLGKVSLVFPDRSVEFYYASNPTRTKSYFVVDGQVIEVAVPGYRDNVIGIFQLHPDQWRDRLIINGSWRTIQEVYVDQPVGGTLEIVFKDKFFLVNGQQPQDSSAVIDYLNQYEYFQANEMISKGRFPKLDSLAETRPMATINIDDINRTNPLILNIFPRKENENYHLVSVGNKQMVIDKQRVGNLLALPSDFLSK